MNVPLAESRLVSMPDILISEKITGKAVDALAGRFSVVSSPDLRREPDALRARIPDFRALIAFRLQGRVSFLGIVQSEF
jgi:hypothetical protein